MNKIISIKYAVAPVAVIAVVVGVMNFGSYNPYNELSSLVPVMASAQSSADASSDASATTETTIVISGNEPVAISSTQSATAESSASADSSGAASASAESSATAISSCNITASASSVVAGSSVVVSWETEGFASVTINGETVSSLDGSRTYANLQTNTTYTLVAASADSSASCTSVVVVGCTPAPAVPAPTCNISPANSTITSGQSVTLNWTSTNAVSASLTGFGSVELNGSRSTGALTSATNYTLTVVGSNGQTASCNSAISIKPSTQIPSCPISTKSGRTIINFAEQKLLSNKTANDAITVYTAAPIPAGTYDITLVSWDGYEGRQLASQAYEVYKVNLIANTTIVGVTGTISDLSDNVIEAIKVEKVNSNYVLSQPISAVRALHAAYPNNTSANSLYPICMAFDAVNIAPEPVPSCDSFSASPTTITRGSTATLSWTTSNAGPVAIDNGIGMVAADGTYSVAPIITTVYTLTAQGLSNQRDTCSVTITVNDPNGSAPRCDAFTASPASLPTGGGSVVLNWSTTNATGVSISPNVGSVSVDGSATTSITTSTNFVLTATNGVNQAQCTVSVPVSSTPTPISCSNNVNFTASPTSVSRGDSSTLTWSTTGITGVSFDNGITATGLSGSTTVSPNDSTTYTLRATDGTNTISCPVTISVTTSGGGGGGGGGSSSPRCELDVSDNKINLGDSVKLTWDTSRATSLTLVDKTTKNTIVTTDGLSSSAKDRLMDGTITVSPKKDTEYVLTVKKGSKTRTCTVKVDLDGDVVIKEVRDQQPLVSGIALTSVPYTGFEAGPILTVLFYTLLLAWSLYIAYLLVIRRDVLGGLQLATNKPVAPKFIPEQIRPDVFVEKIVVDNTPAVVASAPVNLPTAPMIGYASQTDVVSSNTVGNDVVMTEIENHAHAKKVLLSSDAIRHFVATTNSRDERITALNDIIAAAKAQFPAEDGWIVVNEKRMQELCTVCAVNTKNKAIVSPTILPEGAGSLAEAIVTGNVLAAYELIGHRPMFALADAAADLDAVYRLRRGETGVASELLMKETAKFSEEQILSMIQALTGALDGTYTDEASAVKMAIMKAIKAAA